MSCINKEQKIKNYQETIARIYALIEGEKDEIVVPWINDNNLIAVLDIDLDTIAAFNQVDQTFLEQLLRKV